MIHWPRRSVIGLDISDRSIEAVQLKRAFRGIAVVAASRLELPAGVVENGLLRQPGPLADQLRTLLHQAKPQPSRERFCLVSLPESQVFSHVFSLPAALNERQVRQAILYEAEQFVPIPLRESYYDFIVVGRRGDQQEVAYVATRRAVVHQYLEACRAAGLMPVAFEPESGSISRALVRRGFGERGVVLLIDFGARTTNAHLIVRGSPAGSLTIPRAGEHLTAAVAVALKLTLGEAEQRKRHEGVRFDPPAAGSTPPPSAAAMLTVLHPIAVELRRYVEYARQHRGWPVQRVVLCGGSALLPGLEEYLSAQLSLPVAVGNPLARLAGASSWFTREAIFYADVIGLGLRGLARDPSRSGINLLSRARDELRTVRTHRFLALPKLEPRMAILLAALGVTLAVLAVLIVSRRQVAPLPRPPQSELVDWAKILAPRVHTLRFSFADEGTLPPTGMLRGRWISAAVKVQESFSANGTTTLSRTATLTVRLVNRTKERQRLVSGMRVQAADGTTARLPKAVTIPASSAVEVAVILPLGVRVIPAGRMTLPGLPAALRDAVYGELAQEYRPVVNVVTAVGERDLEAARTALDQRARQQALEQIVAQSTPDEFLVPALAATTPAGVVAQPPVGTPAERWRATYEGQYGAVATPKLTLTLAVQEAFGLGVEPLHAVSFEPGVLDLEQKQFSVIIKTSRLPVEN
mgnify:CR=1 FL=1